MNKRILTIVIVLLVLVGAVGFGVWRSYIEQQTNRQLQERIADKSHVERWSKDDVDTSDWITYRNEVSGYEIKAPKDVFAQGCTYYMDFSKNKDDLNPCMEGQKNPTSIFVDSTEYPQKDTTPERHLQDRREYYQKYLEQETEQEIEVNGISGVIFSGIYKESQDIEAYYFSPYMGEKVMIVALPIDGRAFEFRLLYGDWDERTAKEYEALLKEMISTVAKIDRLSNTYYYGNPNNIVQPFLEKILPFAEQKRVVDTRNPHECLDIELKKKYMLDPNYVLNVLKPREKIASLIVDDPIIEGDRATVKATGVYPSGQFDTWSFILKDKGEWGWKIIEIGNSSAKSDKENEWEMYRDDNIGFEFKYPPEYFIETKEDGIYLRNTETVNAVKKWYEENNGPGPADYDRIVITIQQNPKQLPVEDWYKKYDETYLKWIAEKNHPMEYIHEKFEINNYSVYHECEFSITGCSDKVYFKHKDKIISFSTDAAEGLKDGKGDYFLNVLKTIRLF